MIAELGHIALILAFLTAGVQAFAPALTVRAARLQFVLCLLSFTALITLYVISDMSVANVFQNSHTLKPLLYKVSGAWGNHEGSILLWVLILSLYGAALSLDPRVAAAGLQVRGLRVQGLLSFGFTAFVLLASNPFLRLDPAPADGMDLNPLLQDPALALHPPLLYLGYVGFSGVFSLAVAALWQKKAGRAWAEAAKFWVMLAWTFLTAGIALGSWWAYYELGWGGWWFWDPVENASLLPWLLGTALLHSVIVMKKRDALRRWTILLALLTFSLSLTGTFLVRSGVLTSVHAFALDPLRGVFILMLLGLYTGGALLLYALRAPYLSSTVTFAPLSREGALVMNNLLLTSLAATVFTGTLYPLIAAVLTGTELSVGPPYFNAAALPLAAPLLFLMAFGPFLSWKQGDLKGVAQRLQTIGLLTISVMIFVWTLKMPAPGTSLLWMGLSFWLVTGTLAEWARRAGVDKSEKGEFWARVRRMPLPGWGLTLAHAGLGLAVAGMVGTSLWKQESIAALKPGAGMSIGGYHLVLEKVDPAFGPNYNARRATIHSTAPDGRSFTLYPETRQYPLARSATTEAAIRTDLRGDLYVTLGDYDKNEGWTVRVFIHPLISCLWLGFALMAAGGAAALTEKRHA